jgi:serine/threonine-protein kinase
VTDDGERWQRIRALFDELVELPTAERDKRLLRLTSNEPALATELASLLAADRAVRDGGDRFEDAVLPNVVLSAVVADHLPDDPPLVGMRVGPYRVTREIGRGGMGRVYEAVRDDAAFTKRVALKMVAPGLDTEGILRRFHHERQILARLDHKNIATLLDGGVTENGRPYFAMEYVEGDRIDLYCARQAMGVRARLQLMRQVCAAVQYAHRNLVVHRDLKPSNVLVAPDGTVKLLDFGIAKLLDPVTAGEGITETGMVPLTTSHASPEQVRGDAVTTATDVYSLGVLLYELIAGRPPFGTADVPIHELRRRILEDAPVPPSLTKSEAGAPDRLGGRLDGELDQIVLMALRKEPERRYASAEELSADLGRLTSGQPVRAQPDSLGYRTRKLVGRNRVAVAGTVAVALALVGGLAASLWQARVARRASVRAEAVNRFLQELLSAANPEAGVTGTPSRQRTVTDVLDSASARLQRADLAAQPEVRAALQQIIGNAYLAQGQYDAARPNLEAALVAQRSLYGEQSPEVLGTLVSLAQLALTSGDYAGAEPFYSDRLAILRREHRRGRLSAVTLAGALNDFALLRRARGSSRDAESLMREAVAVLSGSPDESTPAAGKIKSVFVLTLLDQGKFGEAEAEAQRLVASFRQLPNPMAPELCSGLTLLGSVLMERGQLTEAARVLRDAESRYRALYDSNFLATYDNVRLQAQTLYGLGRLAEADARIDESLTKYRQYVKPEYISYATALTVKGLILNGLDRGEEAEQLLREAVRVREANLPPGHFMTALTHGALGEVLVSRGRFAEAESLLVRSHESLQESQAEPNERVALAKNRLVALYTAWQRPDLAAGVR